MNVLVAYASRHGATQGIAERIAAGLRGSGLSAEALPAKSVTSLAGYDAFVVGSAAYMFHWLGEARDFVHHHEAALAAKSVWLFSSGPLGTEPLNDKGIDQKVAAVPKEAAELVGAVHARDHHVFFGAYEADQKPKGLAERFVSLMPAARNALPSGDFRDWPEIDAWAAAIAAELQPVAAGRTLES